MDRNTAESIVRRRMQKNLDVPNPDMAVPEGLIQAQQYPADQYNMAEPRNMLASATGLDQLAVNRNDASQYEQGLPEQMGLASMGAIGNPMGENVVGMMGEDAAIARDAIAKRARLEKASQEPRLLEARGPDLKYANDLGKTPLDAVKYTVKEDKDIAMEKADEPRRALSEKASTLMRSGSKSKKTIAELDALGQQATDMGHDYLADRISAHLDKIETKHPKPKAKILSSDKFADEPISNREPIDSDFNKGNIKSPVRFRK